MSYLIDTELQYCTQDHAPRSPIRLAVELSAARGQLRRAQQSSYFPMIAKASGDVRSAELRIEQAQKEVWRARSY